MAITKEQFQAFEDVRASGITNMFDTKMVASESDGLLSKGDVMEVIKQYESLAKTYGEGVDSCPECEGENLNEEGTRCWDCDPESE